MIWLITAPEFPLPEMYQEQERLTTHLPESAGHSMPGHEVITRDQEEHTTPFPGSAGHSMPGHEVITRDQEVRTTLFPGSAQRFKSGHQRIPRNQDVRTTQFPEAAGHLLPEHELNLCDQASRKTPFPEAAGHMLSEHEVIQSAFDAGLETLLLRKPGWNESDYARWLEGLPSQHRAKVIVATFPSLVETFMLKGVHLSEDARAKTAPYEIRKLREAGKWVSTSIHHDSTVVSGFDFVLMGPVFDSISKPGYNARPCQSIPPNAIAIGGIHAGNIAAARAKGFCGAAVLGAAWGEPERMSEIISTLITAWPSSKNSIHPFKPDSPCLLP
ncbi:thiamine phosphate synthase [Chitinophaga sp. NPDC101104]|uniref:thiamine phosphate synthase n=1 Tax=Chitinophaga sp. NPDC101104 TaxID=3390561 RepID=UPI003D0807C6